VLCWDLYDVSMTGAFVQTGGPLDPGTRLHLEIIFGKEVVRLQAEVVRVQEPTWQHVGGIGVRFLAVDPESRRTLEAFVHQSRVLTTD
jgi:c-di-GMP-binding flagellar brake protein YcgR